MFSPKVLNVRGHCNKSNMNEQTQAWGPGCLQNRRRLSQRSQGLFTSSSLQHYSAFVSPRSFAILLEFIHFWELPASIFAQVPRLPALILSLLPSSMPTPPSLSSAQCPHSPASPQGPTLTEAPLPDPLCHRIPTLLSCSLLLSLPTPFPDPCSSYPCVTFKIEYISGRIVFWEVAVSPSCDSYLVSFL